MPRHALLPLGELTHFLSMPIRKIALIGPLTSERRVIHTAGYPLDPKDMLPTADVVLIVGEYVGESMLFRYTAHGEFAGDTPHDNVAAATMQAESEYGNALLDWMDVPEDVADAHDFAIRYAADRLNQRDE
jgi:hypothetical protein